MLNFEYPFYLISFMFQEKSLVNLFRQYFREIHQYLFLRQGLEGQNQSYLVISTIVTIHYAQTTSEQIHIIRFRRDKVNGQNFSHLVKLYRCILRLLSTSDLCGSFSIGLKAYFLTGITKPHGAIFNELVLVIHHPFPTCHYQNKYAL